MRRKNLGTLLLLLALLVPAALFVWLGGEEPQEMEQTFAQHSPAADAAPDDANDAVPPAGEPPAPTVPGGFGMENPLLGQPAPDFERETMDGEVFRLSEHRGEVVVLNFWATWCAPCREEIPDFIALQRALGPEGVNFVGVSLDEGGFEEVRPFAESFGINYPIVMDDGRLAETYGAFFGLPTTILIDRQGRVRESLLGLAPRDRIEPLLQELLAEQG